MKLQDRIAAMRATGRRQMPLTLQREVIRHVAEQRRRGRTARETLAVLGISEQRLSYWRKKSASQGLVPFRPVVVAAEAMPSKKELVLEVGAHARVRGLDVTQLGELLRALG